MAQLTTELTTEHETIQSLLADISDKGIVSPQARVSMDALKKVLLDHLRKEDERLYPRLRAAGASDAHLKWTLDFFARDLEDVTKAATLFFDTYANGGPIAEFARDFGRLSARLRERIRKEENLLYPEFERRIDAAR